ncbi:hypothetical protein B4U79_12874 [Dinothrombium tinctorium]|uniref:C2 NT-type domain-containing protein n=1 Tax=Dinothrombium tinctorium TaxID=1965070 RepID=A0A3S3RTX1_9ACAR|nr:hypothetical protein B4U79_12874 [Dinothrombium tinctorium]
MFMVKKKKYQFSVDLCLDELSSVPFVNAVLFAKIRLLDDRNFNQTSQREEESKGGRSFQKLGFADIDLAEFAGSGFTTKRYLLEGYDTKHRQDNSTLKVSIEMILLSGDPLFKRPSRSSFYTTSMPECMNPKEIVSISSSAEMDSTKTICSNNGSSMEDPQLKSDRKGAECDCYSGGSVSSGFGSLPRNIARRPSLVGSDIIQITKDDNSINDGTIRVDFHPHVTSNGSGHCFHTLPSGTARDTFEIGHSRNSSTISQQSKVSAGYGSLPSHSRQGSTESGHIRNPSSGSGLSDSLKFNSAERKQRVQKKLMGCSDDGENRVDSTRVNAEQLITEFLSTNLKETDEGECQDESEVGLQLFVGKDGTATLGSRHAKSTSNSKKNGSASRSSDSRPVSGTNSRQSSADKESEGSIRL